MVKGDLQYVFCTAEVSDTFSNHDTIKVTGNKEMRFHYGLNDEDFDEYSIQYYVIQESEAKEKEETQEAYEKRISDTFQVLPLPDMEKSLIGPEVINAWMFSIRREYPNILYRLLQYAVVNCPYLQYLESNGVNIRYKVTFSIPAKVRSE